MKNTVDGINCDYLIQKKRSEDDEKVPDIDSIDNYATYLMLLNYMLKYN